MSDNGLIKSRSLRESLGIAVLGSLIGSIGSVSLVFKTDLGQSIARPDPFTGTQGAALINRVDHLEEELDEHTNRHPDLVNQTDRRITRLETQIGLVLENQSRILDNLNQHMQQAKQK